jgi:hypothetical protein
VRSWYRGGRAPTLRTRRRRSAADRRARDVFVRSSMNRGGRRPVGDLRDDGRDFSSAGSSIMAIESPPAPRRICSSALRHASALEFRARREDREDRRLFSGHDLPTARRRTDRSVQILTPQNRPAEASIELAAHRTADASPRERDGHLSSYRTDSSSASGITSLAPSASWRADEPAASHRPVREAGSETQLPHERRGADCFAGAASSSTEPKAAPVHDSPGGLVGQADFPTPGSPDRTSALPSPASTRSQSCRSSCSSARRSTSAPRPMRARRESGCGPCSRR